MSDADLAITATLERLFPVSGSPDWDAVIRTATGGPSSRKRLRLVAVVAVAVLAFAAVAIAAVREAPWWKSGAPPVDPQAVASVARDNMPASVRVADARTVATDGDAVLVAAPLNQSGYCLIPALDGRATFGASCIYQVTHPEQGDSDSTQTARRAKGSKAQARWIAYGRITDPRASKIDLGAFTVGLAPGGFFVTEIPEAKWSELNGSANRGAILDSSGHVLRSGCVNWGASPDGSRSTGPSRSGAALWLDQPRGECRPQTLPPIPTVDLKQAKKLFEVTLTQPFSIWKAGEHIAFEEAPASDGTTCVNPVGPRLPTELLSHGCGTRIPPAGQSVPPIDAGIGAGLAHNGSKAFYSFDITGSTDRAAQIAKLTLASPSASAEVTYSNNFFFAQLPATTPGPRVGTVPFPDGPWILTGYDAAGREVARVNLNDQYRRATPH
jgi:hypothetical protein